MRVTHYDSTNLLGFDALIKAYLNRSENLKSFIMDFPDSSAFQNQLKLKNLDADKRKTLVSSLQHQYSGVEIAKEVQRNIEALESPSAFTVTTGHQLCLFTGPLYFIYKILSTIKLSRMLGQQFPDKQFVPVYWMASEDHDFDEIASVSLFGQKFTWIQEQAGAVGEMSATGVIQLIDQLLPHSLSRPLLNSWCGKFRQAYHNHNLASATRLIVNELFGEYGLVIVDGNDVALKTSFKSVMHDELLNSPSFKAVDYTNSRLAQSGYSAQASPREINLFYLSPASRVRIEKTNDGAWGTSDRRFQWTKEKLLEELENHPENFSPNVILRPVYQESVLPNLAYVGGPGELAYWFQLKGVFDHFGITYPLIILRDSALLISHGSATKMDKLNISVEDLFSDKKSLTDRIVGATEISFDKEKSEMADLFRKLAQKLKQVDSTLESAAMAESAKAESSLDNLEKKLAKAIRNREEIKIQQLGKILNEVFPEGLFQERHDNFFSFLDDYGPSLIEALLDSFNPMENRLTVMFND